MPVVAYREQVFKHIATPDLEDLRVGDGYGRSLLIYDYTAVSIPTN
jgi:hypothetical protein